MLNRVHFFIFMFSCTVAYGFYIITSDAGDDLRYPGMPSMELGDESEDVVAFVPDLAFSEPAAAVFDSDDADYLDRVGRLQHALRMKRDAIALADAFSQNLAPNDVDGIQLVRSPVVEIQDDNFGQVSRVVKRSNAALPIVIVD